MPVLPVCHVSNHFEGQQETADKRSKSSRRFFVAGACTVWPNTFGTINN
jgi:hypothetical protein